MFDVDSRGTPIAYKKSEQFKNLGMYGESDDITGGMGFEGVAEFDKFAKAGGVLVTLGAASSFPAEFGLAPKVDATRTTAQFYSPGAIIDAEILQPVIGGVLLTFARCSPSNASYRPGLRRPAWNVRPLVVLVSQTSAGLNSSGSIL